MSAAVAADESKNRHLIVAKEGVQELQEYGSSEWAGCRTKVHHSQYLSCPELPQKHALSVFTGVDRVPARFTVGCVLRQRSKLRRVRDSPLRYPQDLRLCA